MRGFRRTDCLLVEAGLHRVGPPNCWRQVRHEAFFVETVPVNWARLGQYVQSGAYADHGPASDNMRPPAPDVLVRELGFPRFGVESPAVRLTWAEATAIAHWAGGRLPRAVEWEIAVTLLKERGHQMPTLLEWCNDACGDRYRATTPLPCTVEDLVVERETTDRRVARGYDPQGLHQLALWRDYEMPTSVRDERLTVRVLYDVDTSWP